MRTSFRWLSGGGTAGLRALVILLFVALVTPAFARAGAPGPHVHVRSIAVDSMGTGDGAEALRQRIVDRLRKHQGLRLAASPAQADVVLRGTSGIWPTGSFSISPHSNSYRVTNYEGYLSVELADKSGQTLWSYLVTPSRFRSTSITDNLADQAVSRLLDALHGIEGGAAPATISGATARAQLHAAGSTLAAPLYMKWFESAGIAVRYDANGSEAGLKELAEGSVDFAASDMPPDASLAEGHVTVIPTVAGGVVPIYNLPEARGELRLTPAVLAGIYSGEITKWNDPRLRAINKGTHLPDAKITVVHRSDGSGTTFVWTSYLARVSPGWKSSVGAGARVQWPVGVSAVGNDSLAEMVQKTPNSIGYVELIFAIQHQLNFAEVENPAGQFIKADLSTITNAAADAARGDGGGFGSSILNSPKKDAYPISTFTWLVVPAQGLDAQKKSAITELLTWMLTSGQKQCASLGYAPLPPAVAAKALSTVNAMK
jgi:phosphate ABC transporter phosphate-binding protein